MITDYPPSSHPTWRLTLHEAVSFVATALLYPFGRRVRVSPTPRARRQRTLVLVHGWLCNPSCFAPMRVHLRRHGYRQILPFAYPSTQGIEHGAVALHRFMKDHVRGGEVDLICHSLGGLVARTYLQVLGGARRVDRCITLGTPHYGTYNAYWVPTRVGREMRPGSPLLQRLDATRDASERVRYLSIIGGSDALVIPRVFARHGEEVYLPDTGHMAMLYSPAVWRMIRDYLHDDALHVPETAIAAPVCGSASA